MTHKTHYTPDAPEHIEPWHRHTAAEGAPQEEHAAQVNTRILAIFFTVIVLFVAGTIGVTIVYFHRVVTLQRRASIETTVLAEEFVKYRDGARAALADYGWSRVNAGAVSLPMDEAMDRVVRGYAQAGGDGR